MILPPVYLRLLVVKDGRRKRNLRLPLVLFWPIALALWLVLMPLALVAALLARSLRLAKAYIVAPAVVFYLACCTRGLTVQIDKPDEIVDFRIR